MQVNSTASSPLSAKAIQQASLAAAAAKNTDTSSSDDSTPVLSTQSESSAAAGIDFQGLEALVENIQADANRGPDYVTFALQGGLTLSVGGAQIGASAGASLTVTRHGDVFFSTNYPGVSGSTGTVGISGGLSKGISATVGYLEGYNSNGPDQGQLENFLLNTANESTVGYGYAGVGELSTAGNQKTADEIIVGLGVGGGSTTSAGTTWQLYTNPNPTTDIISAMRSLPANIAQMLGNSDLQFDSTTASDIAGILTQAENNAASIDSNDDLTGQAIDYALNGNISIRSDAAVDVDPDGFLYIDPTSRLNVDGSLTIGAGATLQATNGSAVTIQQQGSVQVTDGSDVEVNSGNLVVNSNATLSLASDSNLNIADHGYFYDAGNIGLTASQITEGSNSYFGNSNGNITLSDHSAMMLLTMEILIIKAL